LKSAAMEFRHGSHNLNYVVPWPLISGFDDSGGTAKTDE
jgi:hypothetical protein